MPNSQLDLQADEALPVRFHNDNDREADELDMTPMVDVTFLLLIFFMVTAAFSLQKSIESPPPDPEQAEQARTIQELEEDSDYVIVQIDRDNAVWVGESEAPSEQDLLVKLRAARFGGGSRQGGPTRLLVLADTGCRHETVVRVLDAGNAIGFESLRLATVDEYDF